MNIKLIEGYEGRYGIAEDGTLWSYVNDAAGRKRKVNGDKIGYCRTVLCDAGGGRKTVYLHRLVAEAFLPNECGCTDVNHIDGNPRNNRVENLEWVTHKDNILKAMAIRGNWLKECAKPKLRRAVVGTSIYTGEERTWESGRLAAIEIGDANKAANIWSAINYGGVSYGYRWRYRDAEKIPELVQVDDGYRSPVFAADDMSIQEVER
jgi:hypothetical protein